MMTLDQQQLRTENPVEPRRTRRARDAIVSAFQGFFVDMVDVYVAIIALTPAMIYFQPSTLSPEIASTLASLTLVATLIARPLGSLLFGSLADSRGRRGVTLMSIAGFGILTLAIAGLPGYATWGLFAPIALIVLRFLSGIFLGGEYSASFPLALEYTAPARRGFIGALITGAYPLAYVFVSLVVIITLQFAPAGGSGAAYTRWGWRVAFIVGGVLALAFLAYRWKRLPESEVWEKAAKEKTTSVGRDFLNRDVLAGFAKVSMLMTGMWMASLLVIAVVPAQLISALHVSATTVSALQIAVFAIAFVMYVGGGVLAQRIGRRRFLVAAGVVIGTVGALLYALFRSGLITSRPGMFVLAGVVILLMIAPFSVVTTFINDQFDTTVRSRGFGIGYGFSLVFGSLYSFYMLGLGTIMPYSQTGTVLLIASGIFIAAGAYLCRSQEQGGMGQVAEETKKGAVSR